MSSEMTNRSEANTAALAVADVMNTGAAYTDLDLKDRKQAVAFYNATANPQYKLKEHVNEVINLAHVSVECCEVNNEDDDRQIAPRIVLIDADGISYGCVSIGIPRFLCAVSKVPAHGVPPPRRAERSHAYIDVRLRARRYIP